jgi:hypothetical protein
MDFTKAHDVILEGATALKSQDVPNDLADLELLLVGGGMGDTQL